MKSDKNYICAVCLSGIFGVWGIHHFYLGCWMHGLLDLGMTLLGIALLLTGNTAIAIPILGVDIIHTLIVTIMLLIGVYKDGNGKIVTYPGQVLNQNPQP